MQGFSLLEVLFVVAFLALLSVFAYPNVHHYRQQQRLQTEVQKVYAHAQETRLRSIGLGVDHWFGIREHHGQLAWCWWRSEQTPECVPRDDRVNYQWNFASGDAARFTAPIGMAGFSAGHIEFMLLDAPQLPRVRMVVSTLGRIRLCTQGPRWSGYAAC
ncbi:prepilin-type N-terminal cleavage/methylation domain-containing protein [Aliidiomarina halalkaliphila]|uniref:Prepilin-type N-terminal cleavage/methylation domain-containing protein n=1 Tax=Aliidiomarina halalkaliphila TaxID=2593535 RepID=A0A552X5I0_9GAMM|nr:prepilin-type N-terminal cleavage/methylation domain-containing protein [Aliidiomarina halalkaliphila]TRW50281.1 prepilin-type N-terminal cleavage/methylation domain-containing protein [Aliidiomarina halalkaliphila]